MSIQPSVIVGADTPKPQMDLATKFYEERSIFLTGTINDAMAESLVQQLLYLDKIGNDPIKLYINSPGGYCHSGLAILDTMELIESPVYGIAMGQACSMAATILCRCDHRSALKGTEIMFHQLSASTSGNHQDMKVYIERNDSVNNYLLQKMAEGCGKTVEQMRTDTIRDFYLTAQEAKEYGAIDVVISPNGDRKGKRKFSY